MSINSISKPVHADYCEISIRKQELLKSIPSNKKKKKDWIKEWNKLERLEDHISLPFHANQQVLQTKPWENQCTIQEILSWRDLNYRSCKYEEQIDRREGSDATLCEDVYGMPPWAGLDSQLGYQWKTYLASKTVPQGMLAGVEAMETPQVKKSEMAGWDFHSEMQTFLQSRGFDDIEEFSEGDDEASSSHSQEDSTASTAESRPECVDGFNVSKEGEAAAAWEELCLALNQLESASKVFTLEASRQHSMINAATTQLQKLRKKPNTPRIRREIKALEDSIEDQTLRMEGAEVRWRYVE